MSVTPKWFKLHVHDVPSKRKQQADFELGDGSAAGTGGDDGDEEILLDGDIECY